MVSQKLRQAVHDARENGIRQYEIARRARVHATVFSALLNGAIDVHPGDPRILGGQLKTDNFWTGKTDNFRRSRLVSSTSRCPPSASPCGLSSASFSVRT